jgi:chromate transporter
METEAMTRSALWSLVATFAPLSLMMFGGANAIVPEIHRQAVDVHGWMNNAEFATLFAIAQVAPGPNILVVSLIGWQVAGLAGLLVASIAINVPHCLLTYAVGHALARAGKAPWIKAVKDGLVPVTVGLILASGVVMARAAANDLLTIAIAVGTAAFLVFTNRNPLWMLGAGMIVSLAGAHLGPHVG